MSTEIPVYSYQTGTKYITSRHSGSPSLIREYGSLTNLLKTVLTEGFNRQIISSVDILSDQEIFKVNVPLNHGFTLNQVVIIEGADQQVFNREYRIVNYDSEFIELIKPDTYLTSVSTSTELTIKVAPLGYTIPYENEEEGVICFKNKSLKSPAILRMIDKLPPNDYDPSWAMYSRVTIGQQLDSAGNFSRNIKAPYHPDYPYAEDTGDNVKGAPGIHGFAKWEYAIYYGNYDTAEYRTPSGTFPTDWRIIGDDKTFYLMIRSMGKDNFNYNLLGYGNYLADNTLETTNICLQAKDGFMPANSQDNYSFSRTRNFFGALNYSYSGFILTDIYNSHTSNFNRHYNISTLVTDERIRPWRSNVIKSLNPASGKWVTGFLYIKDYDGYVRGRHRGVQLLYGTTRLSDEMLDSYGSLYLNVQEPYHTSSSYNTPMIFTLQNWEPIE